MKRRNAIALGIGVALLAAAGSAAVSVWDVLSSNDHHGPAPRRVPLTYDDVRNTPGHSLHLATHEVTCEDCHSVREEGFTTPDPAVCVRCHEEQHPEIHPEPTRDTPSCLGCHRFGPDESITPTACMRCHAEPHGGQANIIRHAETECVGCHRAHDAPSLAPAACINCHEVSASHHGFAEQAVATPTPERPTTPVVTAAPHDDGGAGGDTDAGAPSPPIVVTHENLTACLECHTAHAEPAHVARACLSCHAEDVTASHATFRGHDACTNCHAPHLFAKRDAKPCTSCHADQITLASRTAAPHAVCTSCHRPHDPRSASVARCRECHRDVTTDHTGGGECLGCHAAHPSAVPSANVAAVRAGVAACTTCHTGVRAHAGDLQCASCHTEHTFAITAPLERCPTCHAAVAQRARSVSGHTACTRCHASAAHRPARPTPACGTCHGTEAATAPRGHRECASCHRDHDGARLPAAQCESCHANRRVGHGAAARLGRGQLAHGCQTCHRPHGPSGVATPPTCASCHTLRALPGMHRIADHHTCADCHRAHEADPSADRATCTGRCHQDRRAHEPDASRCNGCHVFTRGG